MVTFIRRNTLLIAFHAIETKQKTTNSIIIGKIHYPINLLFKKETPQYARLTEKIKSSYFMS